MTEAQVIVLATPVFFLLIGLEFAYGKFTGKNTYRLYDAMSSISAGILSQLTNITVKALGFGVYFAAFELLAFKPLSTDSLWVWVSAVLLYDLCYYWNHRAGHRVTLLWAAHAVHHQSEDYNLSTALRQTSTGWMFGWVFYLPLAILGYPPEVVAVAGLIDLLYQYWVHTEHVPKLGWFDRVFCSPSNHRVHHAVNDEYLDKNYGGIFIFWDRLFGTFKEEDEAIPCVYGTRSRLQDWSPVTANFQVYRERWAETKCTPSMLEKLKLWFLGPEWHPRPTNSSAFNLAFTKYEPKASFQQRAASAGVFVAALITVSGLLWFSEFLSWQSITAGTLVAAVLMHIGMHLHRSSDCASDQ